MLRKPQQCMYAQCFSLSKPGRTCWSLTSQLDTVMIEEPSVNSLTTVGYLLGVFFRLWISFLVLISTSASSYIALETWTTASLTQSLWVHDPLISELSMVRALWPASAPPDWMLPTSPEMVPLQGEWFLSLFVPTRWEMVQPVPTKAFLQPAKAAAMCTAARGEPTHLPLSHLFC